MANTARHSRAPPPTPIATGKGLHSAAVNDRVLTEYLQSSLKIPELHLPDPSSSSSSSRSPSSDSPRTRRTPTAIDLRALRSGDEATERNLVASCGFVGAARVDGHGLREEEVREVVEVVAGVCFAVPEEEKRRWAGRLFGRRVGAREEFRWGFPARSDEEEKALEGLIPEEFPVIREKLQKLCTELQEIAETIGEALSKHLKEKEPSSTNKLAVEPKESLLLLRKYDFHHLDAGCPPTEESNDVTALDHHPCHALSLHISLEPHDFHIQWGDSSSSFYVPPGSIVVTVGRQLQERCSDLQLKSVRGEPMFEPRHDPTPSFSLEFMSSPPQALWRESGLATKTVSFTDQIIFVLIVAILYSFWSYMNTGHAKS